MSLKEPGNEYVWQFQRLDRNVEIADKVVKELHQVCVKGFGLDSDEWATDNRLMLSQSTILGRLLNQQRKVFGIAFYSAPDVFLDGTHFLWEDGICLVKEAQRKGYSWTAIEQAVKMFPERIFGWVGCRTQNPAMFLRYAKLGKTFPFDELYDTVNGERVMNFLLENIAEVQEVSALNNLNRRNGICTEVYPQGRLGDYSIELDGAEPFEKQLKQWEFQRDTGEAVLIVSCLRKSL
jgi:hypothetical protein